RGTPDTIQNTSMRYQGERGKVFHRDAGLAVADEHVEDLVAGITYSAYRYATRESIVWKFLAEAECAGANACFDSSQLLARAAEVRLVRCPRQRRAKSHTTDSKIELHSVRTGGDGATTH